MPLDAAATPRRSDARSAGLYRYPNAAFSRSAADRVRDSVVPSAFGKSNAIGAVASLVLWVEELRKLFVRRRDRRVAREAALQ